MDGSGFFGDTSLPPPFSPSSSSSGSPLKGGGGGGGGGGLGDSGGGGGADAAFDSNNFNVRSTCLRALHPRRRAHRSSLPVPCALRL